MALLSINNIHKSYGEKIVFSGVSLRVHKGEKIGLVGANGAGKTTLLKIITGEEKADQGQVFLAKGVSLGYLSQKPVFGARTTLQEYLEEAVRELFNLKEKMTLLEKEMALPYLKEDRRALSSLMEKYGRLSHLFEQKGGYHLSNRLRWIAGGLCFSAGDLSRPLAEFSGGEKTRAQLASLILREPDLLLLDEPTNYLDMDALEWLEKYLRDYSGTLLLVSHDRYFLDRIAVRIAVLAGGKLKSYRGNYSAYLSQRHVEEISLEKAYKKQQAARQKELAFIRTAKADERTKRQARSREKRLRKMAPLSRPGSSKTMDLGFAFAGRSGKVVLAFENVCKSFAATQLFSGINFAINWGDRVALVGPNGAGKTTLLRMVTGEESHGTGRIIVGPTVRIAYFDQEQAQLDPESTPLQTIMHASDLSETEARKHLGKFLFRGDEVFKKVSALSGGEKSRLALAKVALAEGNFLILDEPTNHLDIAGVEELETALADYPGTLLVVSHDRYFISRIATKILEIREGKVRLYSGSYEEYEESRTREKESSAASLENKNSAVRRAQREKQRAEREKLLALRREKRKLESQLQEKEKEILEQESELSLLEEQLADPGIYENFDEARKITAQFNAARSRVDALYAEWEKTAAQLEELAARENARPVMISTAPENKRE